VNGPISARFVHNPAAATGFKSINGPVDVYFQPRLSADLRFKTFNGEIYSDFDVKPVSLAQATAKRENGRFVYRSNREHGALAGSGGPVISFDVFNGNIRLHDAGKAAGSNE
jgi:hypothetical protein